MVLRFLLMMTTISAKPRLLFAVGLALAPACSTKQGDTTPDFALSESREGLPPEPGTSGLRSGRSGDTLICGKPQRFRTADGDRWLWVRVLLERKTGSDTENTLAETVVSTNPEGTEYDQRVELAGVSLDGEADYTLRNTTGVRTAEAKESPKQAHRARGYTIGPNMGPVDVRCGG
jgi:hypothetical protein